MLASLAITVVEVVLLLIFFFLLKRILSLTMNAVIFRWPELKSEQLVSQRRTAGMVLFLSCAALCMLVVIANTIVMYRGGSVIDFQRGLLGAIPSNYWRGMAEGIIKSALLLCLLKTISPLLIRVLERASIFLKNYDTIKANNESIESVFNSLQQITTRTLWFAALIACASFLSLPSAVSKYLLIILKSYLVFCLGILIIKSISVLVDTLDALGVSLSRRQAAGFFSYYERFRHLLPALKKVLEYMLYIAIGSFIIQQIDFIAWVASYSDEIIKAIGIYFLCGILVRYLSALLSRPHAPAEHVMAAYLESGAYGPRAS
jgi:moderate conductance mechanosensitive channel